MLQMPNHEYYFFFTSPKPWIKQHVGFLNIYISDVSQSLPFPCHASIEGAGPQNGSLSYILKDNLAIVGTMAYTDIRQLTG